MFIMCVCVFICTHMCTGCPQRPEGRIETVGAGVAGICELCSVGAQIQTLGV